MEDNRQPTNQPMTIPTKHETPPFHENYVIVLREHSSHCHGWHAYNTMASMFGIVFVNVILKCLLSSKTVKGMECEMEAAEEQKNEKNNA